VSVGIVIVTHGKIGRALVKAAEFILGRSLNRIRCFAVTQSSKDLPDENFMREVVAGADQGDGVLILTDLACASPSNIAELLLDDLNALVVSGINLPMLLRTWNYREEPLDSLAKRASEGGIRGIEIRDQ
jgi:PTS system ascorbate-specific IIA component